MLNKKEDGVLGVLSSRYADLTIVVVVAFLAGA